MSTAANFTFHDRVAFLRGGRLIAMGRNTLNVDATAAALVMMYVRLPDLRMIEYILQVEPDITAPVFSTTDYIIHQEKWVCADQANVVGISLYAVANTGMTLTCDVIAVGPP